jgi:hypothetical protein
MRTVTKQLNVLMPSYALPYLINGDASGLAEVDKEIIDRWVKKYVALSRTDGTDIIISVVGEYEHFSKYPEFGLPCSITECDILIVTPD